ncbi:MAG: mandelate racemase/muconate lactonizing enzyme family protein [Bryobacterales bacterium]|nr:mandelate racemase/muconate lactonizing enzyme family protein [Bryobacterales bacterium]
MTTRRDFLKRAAGAGACAALPPALLAAADKVEPMRITRIDAVTFRKDIRIGGGSGGSDGAEFCWVRLHTDRGLIGTGETYPFNQGERGALRDYARRIIKRDPRDIDGVWRAYYHDMAMRNAGGADMRILSAINMAQLDILGQASGLPLYRLLGGKTRQSVRVYNTTTDYWAINEMKMGPDTLKITRFLLDRGITAMKLYPFSAADNYLSNQAMERGMRWIREIRDSAGQEMDICVDLWGRFDLPSAQRIAKALEPYNIMYLEDAMLMNNAQAYAQLARETSVPICMSETLATRYEYREFLELKACDVVMFDLTWCGGPSEAKKIADLADTYFIPISPHTCGGPLLYMCSAHVCAAAPNFLIMESNYWKYTHQFPYFVNNVPVPEKGQVKPPELPGIGAEIKPELFRNGDAIVETVAQV